MGSDFPLGFRPIHSRDMEFLYRVYASTRQDELAATGWGEAEKESFLRMQFSAQHKHYQEHFPDAQYLLILLEEEPIGRLYVHRRPDEIRLIDIALLPDRRGGGIGTSILQVLLSEAREVGNPLRIHVERFNPAMSLYERLGFHKVEDQGVYYLMEWSPPS